MTTGIVIGKFYPPHKGHRFLIEKAIQNVDDLTVIICHKGGQKISGDLRASWIRETVPGVKTIVINDIYPEDDSKAWAQYTLEILGFAPDFVFTSEDYGEVYCRYLGSKHISIDRDRNTIPISASQIRANPFACWEYLDPPVKAYFTRRICVIGAESTGTTTLARALASHYQTSMVPEFGRLYYEGRMESLATSGWETSEFIFIAQEQNKLEDTLAQYCNKILICDTDSFATYIWHERYMGYTSHAVDLVNLNRKYELYLLTDVDIPFIQDGTRESEQIRQSMHMRFIEELEKRNKSFLLVSGSHGERMSKSIKACDEILKTKRFID